MVTRRKVKILFVNAGRGIYDMPPLGICYLSSYLRKHGKDRYKIALADEYAGHNPVRDARQNPTIILEGFDIAFKRAGYKRFRLPANEFTQFYWAKHEVAFLP